jgi:hypothetical protein
VALFDIVHLGFCHGPVTLWAGLFDDLQPGDRVQLRPDVRARIGDLSDYDVIVGATTIPVRGSRIRTGAQRPVAARLTSFGNMVRSRQGPDPAGEALLRPVCGYDEQTAGLMLAAGLPAQCPVCRQVRRAALVVAAAPV